MTIMNYQLRDERYTMQDAGDTMQVAGCTIQNTNGAGQIIYKHLCDVQPYRHSQFSLRHQSHRVFCSLRF